MQALDGVSNVVIYVADALRWDSLGDGLARSGITFQTVAQSTFSAPSFATLSTGRYPSEHGVMAFDERIPPSHETVFDVDGVETAFFQALGYPSTENPIFDVLRLTDNRRLEDLTTPFLYMERDMLTHFPHDDGETAPSYLRTRGNNWTRIRREYEESVSKSADRLHNRLQTIEDMGVRDDTLVVVTSDHGELLGEHGEIAHGTPLCPELAYVPTVFIHPELNAEAFATDPDTSVIEHTDIVETVLSVLDPDGRPSTSGVNILEVDRDDRPGYSTVTYPKRSISFLPRTNRTVAWPRSNVSRYAADGLFWRMGSHVFTNGSALRRLPWVLHRLSRSHHRFNVRPHAVELLQTYLPRHHRYGTPPVSHEEAANFLDTIQSTSRTEHADENPLDDEARDRLHDLGYL